MRAILTLLALAVLVLAALMYFGVVHLSGTPGTAPTVHAEVGHVEFGQRKQEVTVPTVSVVKPGDPATNGTAPR